jgi:hypothetical protein
MRTTIVPAQMTTVEDKVIGNLNVPQLILLTIPVALSGFIFALLPAKMSLNYYKFALILFNFLCFGLLAFRIRGKLIIDWLVIIFRYNLRPKYYVFDKNTTFLRIKEIEPEMITDPAQAIKKLPAKMKPVQAGVASFAQLLAKKEQILKRNVSFVIKDNKKGETYVVVK